MNSGEWGGEDRRSIPIHILNYVKDTVTSETEEIKRIFAQHSQYESDRYNEILESQRISSEKAQERYNHLIRSVEAYTNKTEALQENMQAAFLTTRHGKPDYLGHANAHESWIESAADTKKLLKDIRLGLILAGATALGTWILPLIWNGVLVGPK